MTRYEQIIALSKQKMVEFITNCTNMCEYCPCDMVCTKGSEAGSASTKCVMLLQWLDSEGDLDDYITEVE